MKLFQMSDWWKKDITQGLIPSRQIWIQIKRRQQILFIVKKYKVYEKQSNDHTDIEPEDHKDRNKWLSGNFHL